LELYVGDPGAAPARQLDHLLAGVDASKLSAGLDRRRQLLKIEAGPAR